ncbi:uncharacterized protein [Magallana gigas]|uniref:uncharacterized protein isoform X1 n=1 Tax=Magallana gigas TaxID=29159 RepID=UPI00333E6F93
MDSVVMLFVLYWLNLLNITQGQCLSNGTCVCHCENCTYGCTACLPGWSGSTTNNCQKSNTFFQLPAMDKLFDGDSKTYKVDKGHDPYVRSQFNTSAKIDQLDITLVLEYGITYTVSVRQISYKFLESEICYEFTHNDVSTERTVTVTCKRPLQGKYIVIVASSPSETTLKVFEIERFECSNGTFGEHCSKICPDGCNKQCDKKTGDCVCKNGRWGNSCNQTCPSFCDKNACNSITGDCYGCVSGYYGVKCDKECSFGCQNICNMTSGICSCKSGFYLSNCSLTCPPKCLNNECLQEKGTCLVCHKGTYGDFCDLNCFGDCYGQCDKEGICGICANNKYGTYCNQTCPKNCEAGVCKRGTGYCENCKIGYMGEQCDESCPEHCEDCSQNGYECKRCADKWYGVKCELNCPPGCGENGSCNIKSGMCNVCPAGYYGNKCTQKCSSNCASNKICDQSTGNCQTCKAGWYGLNCSEHCNSNCMNSTCFSNQSCAFGCKDGWFGAQCDNKCDHAIRKCGQCDWIENATVCRQCSDKWYLMETDCFECPKNCSSCMSDEECLECKNNFYHGKTCNSTCNTACINKTCDMTGYCKEGCEDGRYGVRCDQNCLEHCKTCHNSTMCLQCEDGYFGESCQMCPEYCKKCENYSTCTQCKTGRTHNNGSVEENDADGSYCNNQLPSTTHTLIASVVPILLMIVILSSVFCLIVGQLKQKWKNRRSLIVQHTIQPLLKRTGHCYENAGISVYNTRGSQALLEEIDPDENSNNTDIDEFESHNYVNVTMTRISVQRLWEYKLQNTANDSINTEFKNQPTGLLLKCKEAKKSENKKRNRYKYVYPYDANRVMLPPGEKCNNSYINASYINGFEALKEYIASQGPFTDETVTDFWRMVWNENVNTIVVLTNLEENGVKKCRKYWPTTETMYGDIQVKTLSSDSSSCYKVRRFQITLENEVRTVKQFHFTAWPDKGVPSSVNSILDFRRKIRRKADITSPIVVHCSAGIGRTGTFIALDFLINQGQKEGSVDVVSCVTNLRYQRTHLVQTVEQYNYLYGAVTKELTGKESGIQENEFMTYYSQMKRINQSTGTTFIEEEFNLIEKLAPDIDENRYQTAKAVNNRHKNRHSNILADDNFRIYINTQDGDYINAISLPSAQQNFAYIITHTPLPETVDDFFSMMADHEVLTIVQLDNDADEVFGNRCQSKDETFFQNSFELNPQEKTTFGNFELLACHFQDDHALVSRHVKLYRGRFWKGSHVVPNDLQPMISLVETILNRRREQMENPVVVVCRDGAQRSGLFCVLANLVEQLQLSGSVDILQTVLNVRHRRPQIVPCLEQLEYIYDFIKKYLESGNKV